jgi:sugar O-acyltransferase (sialic acid O-acetyltransferase NeuD family)
MSNRLAIIGAGHLGKQIAHIAIQDGHFQSVCFFDDTKAISSEVDSVILGGVDEIEPMYGDRIFDSILIGIGYKHMKTRMDLFERFIGRIPFATIIHSSVNLDASAQVGAGSILYPGSTIDANVTIGYNNLINLDNTVSHDTVVGCHNFLAPRVAIAGFCKIGNQNFIGINATLKDDILVKNNIVIGAGALVLKDLTEEGVYVGSPASKVK